MIEPTAMKSLKVSFTPAIEHSFLLNMLIKLTFLSQKKNSYLWIYVQKTANLKKTGI